MNKQLESSQNVLLAS